MQLDHAGEIAQKLLKQLSPYCRRAEIAGSIRRRKPTVKDIEIVAVPLWRSILDPSDLFGERQLQVNRLHEWAMGTKCPVQWIKPGTSEIVPWKVEPGGRYWRGLLEGDEGLDESIKLDLFLAREQNYGAIKLIRTGSAEFSYAVANYAKTHGMPFRDGFLTRQGWPIPTPQEFHIFQELGIEYVPPEQRTGWEAVREVRAAWKARRPDLQELIREAALDRFVWHEGDIEIVPPGVQDDDTRREETQNGALPP